MTAELSAGIIETSERVDGAHPENVCIFPLHVYVLYLSALINYKHMVLF